MRRSTHLRQQAALLMALGGLLSLTGCPPAVRGPTAAAPPSPPQPAVTAAAQATPATSASGSPSGLEQACRKIAKDTGRVVASVQPDWSAVDDPIGHVARFVDNLGHCHRGPGGAWVIEALDLSMDDAGEEDAHWVLWGAVRLVHLDDDGTRIDDDEGFEVQLGTPPDDGNEATITILGTHDYDGDGVDEVVTEVHRSGYDLDSRKHAILGVRVDEGVRHIGRPDLFDELEFERVEDFDGDGVHDIVTEHMVWSVQPCFEMAGTGPAGTPPVLFHATADHKLSARDAVAAAYLEAQCPNLPGTLLVGGELDWELAAMRRIACARLWGRSAADVVKQIASEWPRLSRSDTHGDNSCRVPRAAFEAFAQIDPPLVLTR